MLTKIKGVETHQLPEFEYPGSHKAGVSQGHWRTEKLEANEYLDTCALTACTGLALWDAEAKVVSLAHFDSSQSSKHIAAMVAEMLKLGAQLSRIRAAISGWEDFNMSATSVYNDLVEVYAGPVSIYRGRDMLVAFGDGRVGWFGLD